MLGKLRILLLIFIFAANPISARQIGLECTAAARGDIMLRGTNFYTPEHLFAKFWIDTDKEAGLFRRADGAQAHSADLVETSTAYTLKQTYCEEGFFSDDCKTYTRAIINRSSGVLKFYSLVYYGDYTKMRSDETFGEITCEPINGAKARAWIRVAAPKF